jgi:hypothetical protein
MGETNVWEERRTMTKTRRCSVLAASVILCCCASGCSTSLSNNRALFKGSDKAGYVEGRSDEIKNLYWAQRNLGAKDADPRLKHKLTEIVVPAHYDSDGELIEAHREVIEVVQ